MVFRYPVPFPNGKGTVNYVPLPIRDDGDVRIMFTVVTQSPPPNTIEMYCQTSSIDYHPVPSSFTTPLHIESLVRVDMAGITEPIVMTDENYVDILPGNDDDNVKLFDEDDGNEDIMDMEDNENTENDASLLGDGEQDVPSPIFRELNWDVINSMADKDLIARTGLWNESDELFKGLRFERKLLIATSIDANGHIFPLAFAIVEEESSDSWSWFLYTLRTQVTQREGICFISDRHAGIQAAIRDPSVGWIQRNGHWHMMEDIGMGG
ncbi:hypothetical protein CK203_057850 [Vitis vinifera]|uniref:MULE transposase domain-containing protein n=1 Tax=Vitis vinifera TaxID=29760 RepID=A0A438GFS8_VITVI|nr:hypothetical protein CK203_057850 [Vitis vinifera]